MKPEEKVWGRTTELFRNNTTSTHYLEIKKGGYCSEHKHGQKENIFYVIEGELELISWDINKRRSSLILPVGKIWRICIDAWHKFHALTDVKCIEVYDYKYDGVDIERRIKGGLNET